MVFQAQAGVAEALDEVTVGDSLVTAIAQDVVRSDASWVRCLALLALTALLGRDARGRWLQRLQAEGHLKAILHSLVDIDTVEADAVVSLAAARSAAASRPVPDTLLDPVSSYADNRTKSRRAGPATGAEAVENLLDGGRGPLAQESLALVNSLLPEHAVVPGAAAATSTALQTLPAAFQATLTLLIRVSSSSAGCQALTQHGCLPVLTNLRWLTRQASAAAGAAGGIFPDEASASMSRSLAPRLEPVLRLVATMVGARPNDSRVAHDALQFVSQHAGLLRSQFQAALSPSCSLTTLRLLGLITGVLARVGMVVPAGAAAAGALHAFDTDALGVLRKKFALQPRAHAFGRARSEALRPQSMAAVDAGTPASSKNRCRWMQGMAPAAPKEDAADAHPMAYGAVGRVIVTSYDAMVARAGEVLISNILAYARLRLSHSHLFAGAMPLLVEVTRETATALASARSTLAALGSHPGGATAAAAAAATPRGPAGPSAVAVWRPAGGPGDAHDALRRATVHTKEAVKCLEFTLETAVFLWFSAAQSGAARRAHGGAAGDGGASAGAVDIRTLRAFEARHRQVVESLPFVHAMLRHTARVALGSE